MPTPAPAAAPGKGRLVALIGFVVGVTLAVMGAGFAQLDRGVHHARLHISTPGHTALRGGGGGDGDGGDNLVALSPRGNTDDAAVVDSAEFVARQLDRVEKVTAELRRMAACFLPSDSVCNPALA